MYLCITKMIKGHIQTNDYEHYNNNDNKHHTERK